MTSSFTARLYRRRLHTNATNSHNAPLTSRLFTKGKIYNLAVRRFRLMQQPATAPARGSRVAATTAAPAARPTTPTACRAGPGMPADERHCPTRGADKREMAVGALSQCPKPSLLPAADEAVAAAAAAAAAAATEAGARKAERRRFYKKRRRLAFCITYYRVTKTT